MMRLIWALCPFVFFVLVTPAFANSNCASMIDLMIDQAQIFASRTEYRRLDIHERAQRVLNGLYAKDGSRVEAQWFRADDASFRRLAPEESLSPEVLAEMTRLTGDRFTLISLDTNVDYLIRESTFNPQTHNGGVVSLIQKAERYDIDSAYIVNAMTVPTTFKAIAGVANYTSHFYLQSHLETLPKNPRAGVVLIDMFGHSITVKTGSKSWFNSQLFENGVPDSPINFFTFNSNAPEVVKTQELSRLDLVGESRFPKDTFEPQKTEEQANELAFELGFEPIRNVDELKARFDSHKADKGLSGLDALKSFIEFYVARSTDPESTKYADAFNQLLMNSKDAKPFAIRLSPEAQEKYLGFEPEALTENTYIVLTVSNASKSSRSQKLNLEVSTYTFKDREGLSEFVKTGEPVLQVQYQVPKGIEGITAPGF